MSNPQQFEVDPKIREICARNSIVDYLNGRETKIIKTGARHKCKCPLPTHTTDNTPSFYIWKAEDGVELFKCFGCGATGNIITLVHLIEGTKKGQIVNNLAKAKGISVSGMAPRARIEPLPSDVLAKFCEEDHMILQIGTLGRHFIQVNEGSEDSVNKVSRIYQKALIMADSGDWEGLVKLSADLSEIMYLYWHEEKDFETEREDPVDEPR